MLRSTNDLKAYVVGASDGPIGHVRDVYFDDASWVVRYLVVETGAWLSSRKVLISPISILGRHWTDKELPVSLTKDQVRNSPDIDTDKPVSRQHEIRYSGYYGYPYYWGGAGLWGGDLYPDLLLTGFSGFGSPTGIRLEEENAYAKAEAARHQGDDPHLRSGNAVTGYHIHATDGDIGHVQGFLVDEETWAIRYLVVDTSNWWLGHQVLIAPRWIKDVSWLDGTVSVDLSRQAVKDAPPYDSAVPLDREQETNTHDHYGRPGYWTDEAERRTDLAYI